MFGEKKKTTTTNQTHITSALAKYQVLAPNPRVRPPKCNGYETKLVEVKSNFYQTCSQKQLNFTKKNALSHPNGWNLVKLTAIENDGNKGFVVNNT